MLVICWRHMSRAPQRMRMWVDQRNTALPVEEASHATASPALFLALPAVLIHWAHVPPARRPPGQPAPAGTALVAHRTAPAPVGQSSGLVQGDCRTRRHPRSGHDLRQDAAVLCREPGADGCPCGLLCARPGHEHLLHAPGCHLCADRTRHSVHHLARGLSLGSRAAWALGGHRVRRRAAALGGGGGRWRWISWAPIPRSDR